MTGQQEIRQSPLNAASDGFRAAQPGELTCLTERCRNKGIVVPRTTCDGCGAPTYPLPDDSKAAQPGELTCLTERCRNEGAVVPRPTCDGCGARTYPVPPESAVFEPMPPMRPAGPRLSIGEIFARILFGGFWAIVTLAGIALSITTLLDREFLMAMAFGVTTCLTGLYSAYLFQGGRFRIIFW